MSDIEVNLTSGEYDVPWRNEVAYISGPMSGIENDNKPAFYKAEEILDGMGYDVINPARNTPGLAWHQYMNLDLQYVLSSDIVVCLDGWIFSMGACMEVLVAAATDKKIMKLRSDGEFYEISRSLLPSFTAEARHNFISRCQTWQLEYPPQFSLSDGEMLDIWITSPHSQHIRYIEGEVLT